MSVDRPPVVIAGCGYTGRRVADLLLARGQTVTGLVRSTASLAQLSRREIPGNIAELAKPSTWRDLLEGTPARALAWLAPPPRHGDQDHVLGAFLATDPPLDHLVYVSTTGVYGDHCGGQVDEDMAICPGTDRARRRAHAEQLVKTWSQDSGRPGLVLRVPGIYGPGRLQLDTLREGRPVPTLDEAGPGNRIHVEDLARAVVAALDYAGRATLFNIGDGDHRSNTQFLMAVAEATGLPAPRQASLASIARNASPLRMSYLGESRCVLTGRMRAELGVTPRFERFEDGIAASFSSATD